MPFDSTAYLEPSTPAETVTLPIYLPAWKVIEEGRKAYLEGRLSAQGPTPACEYRDLSGRPCIIGATLTDEEAASIANGADIDLIPSISSDDMGLLVLLQAAHDQWASEGGEYSERGEANLRTLLGL